jgi:hypothetical protein
VPLPNRMFIDNGLQHGWNDFYMLGCVSGPENASEDVFDDHYYSL